MVETTHQIEAHIEHTREHLGSNLHELEQKVRSVTDWKQHFRSKPMMMMGLALGGGVLLATMLGGRRNRRGERGVSSQAATPSGRPSENKALETWGTIKGALIGVAATRFKDFVGEVVPGFREQVQRADERAKTFRPFER
jgi:hypothetical protein